MNSVAKAKSTSGKNSFLNELFRAGLYKPNQGRIVRQVTFVAAAIIVLLIASAAARWDILQLFNGSEYAFGLAFSVIGLWLAYRLVNYPPFTDFLIAVEAEMNKVSWPSWPELWRAAVVVMMVILIMAVALFLFDVIWSWVFGLLRVRYIS